MYADSAPKLFLVDIEKGSRTIVTESGAIARFVVDSVSTIGADVMSYKGLLALFID